MSDAAPISQLYMTESNPLVMSFGNPQTFVIGDGAVTIDLETGNVTLGPGVTPQEGAKAFWQAVTQIGVKRPCEATK